MKRYKEFIKEEYTPRKFLEFSFLRLMKNYILRKLKLKAKDISVNKKKYPTELNIMTPKALKYYDEIKKIIETKEYLNAKGFKEYDPKDVEDIADQYIAVYIDYYLEKEIRKEIGTYFVKKIFPKYKEKIKAFQKYPKYPSLKESEEIEVLPGIFVDYCQGEYYFRTKYNKERCGIRINPFTFEKFTDIEFMGDSLFREINTLKQKGEEKAWNFVFSKIFKL